MTVAPALGLLDSYQPLFEQPPYWRYALCTGGRGSGKSFHTALLLLNLTYEPGHVVLFTRYTMVAAHLSIIPEFADKIERLGVAADFEITAREIVNTKTGSRILFRGIKTSSGNQTAALKSIQGVTTWVLDEAEELVDERVFDTIDLSIRSVDRPNRVILILNPSVKSHFLYRRFVETPRADTLYLHTTYLDNRENLSPSFVAQAERLEASNPLRYRHVFLGEWTTEGAGLLWTSRDLEAARIDTLPELTRVLVGVDPAITSERQSNETGIVVVGVDGQRRAVVLEDLSGRFTPQQWAHVAVDAARRWHGSIVAEVNQGGDMVRAVLKSVGEKASGIRIVDVRASKGKLARAEPVYSLYQEGRVQHHGHFPSLEQQMLAFRPDDPHAVGSPDRVDALVWAVTSALLTGPRPFVL